MPPKRGKSASASNTDWESGLIAAEVNDDEWKMHLTLLMPTKFDDYSLLNLLSEWMKTGKPIRRLFQIFSYDELLKQVGELAAGNVKGGKKPKEMPQFSEVCEAAKPYLDSGNELPPHLVAKLIKFKLLQIKQNDLKRREAEKLAAEGGEPVKGARGKKSGDKKGAADKKKASSAKKGAKGQQGVTDDIPAPKDGTKLKKRGEEDLENKYLDDEPDDGAQQYVLFYNFQDPYLLQMLDELGCHVNCVLRIVSQPYAREEEPELTPTPAPITAPDTARSVQSGGLYVPGEVTPSPTERVRAELQEKRERVSQRLLVFWRDVRLLLQQAAPRSKLHDLAILEYELPTSILATPDGDSRAARLTFVQQAFEDLAVLNYNLLDLKRQYLNYRTNTRLLRVPVSHAPPEPAADREPTTVTTGRAQSSPRVLERLSAQQGASLSAESVAPEVYVAPQVDLRRYNELLSVVPDEAVSVELLLHCLLEQVSTAAQERPADTHRPQDTRGAASLSDYLNAKLETLVPPRELSNLSVASNHSGASSSAGTPCAEPEGDVTEKLLHPADGIAVRAKSIPQTTLDSQEAESNMLALLEPFRNLLQEHSNWQLQLDDEENKLLQRLVRLGAPNVDPLVVDQALRQLVLESLPLDTQQRAPHQTVWSDPRTAARCLRSRPASQEARRSRPVSSHRTILRSASHSPSGRSSRRSSVKFERTAVEKSLRDEPVDPFERFRPPSPPRLAVPEVLQGVEAQQRRNLDEFCFAERMDTRTMLQTLRDAHYELENVLAFSNPRDRSLMLALHNAPDDGSLSRSSTWTCWLHCDCGFRNYLEHVAARITEWTRQEEAKYEAQMVKAELDRERSMEAEAAARLASAPKPGDKKTPRGKAPQRGRSSSATRGASRAGSKGASRDSSANRSSADEEDKTLFIREESLKAWKAKQDELRRLQEEEERKKEEKARGKPGAKGRAASGKKSGSASARSPARDDAPKREEDTHTAPAEVPVAPPPEPFWPFTGYDVGNQLIHVTGYTNSMFPSDGGVINVLSTDYLHGPLLVRATVKKDGHVFAVHVTDPVKTVMQRFHESFATSDAPPSGRPEPDAASFFAAFSALLSDGVALSFSAYGKQGTPVGVSRPAPAPPATPAPQTVDTDGEESKKQPPTSAAAPSSPRTKSTKRKSSPERERTQETSGEELARSPSAESVAPSLHSTPAPLRAETEVTFATEPAPVPTRVFQEMLISSPCGMLVTFKPEEDRLMVEMSAATESGVAQNEKRRTVRSDGSVLCLALDGSLRILFPDGTVSWRCDYDHLQRAGVLESDATLSPELQALLQPEVQKEVQTPAKKAGRPAKPHKAAVQHEPTRAPVKLTCWVTTAPDGRRVVSVTEEELGLSCVMKARRVPVLRATDPSTRQTLLTRDDGVALLQFPNGMIVTRHLDGTCITSHPPTSQIAPSVVVEHPKYPTVRFDTAGTCTAQLASGTRVSLTSDGVYCVLTSNGGRLLVEQSGAALYEPRVKPLTGYLQRRNSQYAFAMHRDVICWVQDAEGNQFSVTVDGQCDAVRSETTDAARKQTPRLFALSHDGGVELLRYQDVAEYLVEAESDPTAAVLRRKLGGDAQIVSVLRPLQSTCWRALPYQLQSLVPPGLRSRDLKTLPPDELAHVRSLKTSQAAPAPALRGLELELDSQPASSRHQQTPRVAEAPTALETRLFVQYAPLPAAVRSQLLDGLRTLLTQLDQAQQNATELQENAQDQDQEHVDVSVAHLLADEHARLLHQAEQLYNQTLNSQQPALPASSPASDRTASTRANPNAERLQRELTEEKRIKKQMHSRELPNYFTFQLGKQFLHSQVPDLDKLATGLSLLQRSTDAERDSRLSFSPHSTPEAHVQYVPQELPESPTNVQEPQPAGAPDELRSATAREQPDDTRRDSPCERVHEQPAVQDAHDEQHHDKHLYMDVTGDPRKAPVRPPAYLNGGRPNAVPNTKFLAMDDATRSKVNMACFVGLPTARREKLKKMRGFELLPTELDFGAVCEGRMYVTNVTLKNVGMDTCNFRVKQPPPSTGLRVLYDPRSVAAGLKVDLHVQLLGIAIGVVGDSGIGTLAHNIEIVTETDIMRLPVKASILTRNLFEQLDPRPTLKSNIREVACADSDTLKAMGLLDLRRSNRSNQSEVVIE